MLELFLMHTKGFDPGRTIGWTTLGTWYTLFTFKPCRFLPTRPRIVGHNGSDETCNHSKGVIHDINDCAVLQEKEDQRGPNQRSQHHQRKKDAKQGGGSLKSKFSFHRSTTNSDAECRIQNDTNKANAGKITFAASHCIVHDIWFPALEAPTGDEVFWLFVPTDEPVDTGGLFGSLSGVI